MAEAFKDPELQFDKTANFLEVERRVISQSLTRYTDGPYTAQKCRCSWEKCKDWHVSNVAEMQGTCFTEEQAKAVAGLLNFMHRVNE